jgi:hypothetical protein
MEFAFDILFVVLTRLTDLPPGAVGVLLLAGGMAGFITTLFLRASHVRTALLRRCPLCGADAVAGTESEAINDTQARVLEQCGQCGTWRLDVMSLALARRHERSVAADRDLIRRCAERLERERSVDEIGAFIGALRAEIVGADDLLARLGSADGPESGA